MWSFRLHYYAEDEIKPQLDFFTFTWVFFVSINVWNTVRHTQLKFRLGIVFSYGM